MEKNILFVAEMKLEEGEIGDENLYCEASHFSSYEQKNVMNVILYYFSIFQLFGHLLQLSKNLNRTITNI